MAIQLSGTVRDARLDSIEVTVGTSAVVKIFSGSQPTSCGAADSGTTLAAIQCPSDWMNAASGGSKTKAGTWTDASADNTGTAGHFRVYEKTAATCHMQGSVTNTGGGGDMTVNSTSFTAGNSFTINTFTLTDGNS